MPPPHRRVVLLAYHFWPENTIGSARAGRFAKYLPRCGYDCQVIAGGSGSGQNVLHVPGPKRGVGEQLAIQAAELAQRILPNNERLGWVPAAVRASGDLAGRTPVCAVVSTSPPLATHIAALWLKQRFDWPWIADFRDPLVGSPTRSQARLPGFDAFLERRLLESADALLANTDGALETWERRYPYWRPKMHLLWSGYDPEETPPAERGAEGGPRILAHVGNLYGGRNPAPLLASLDRLIRRGLLNPCDFRLRLVGSSDGELERCAQPLVSRLRELGCLEMHGLVSRAEAARHIGQAHYLLVLDWWVGLQVPAKVFEYVLAGKPILVWTESGSPVTRVLANSGITHRFVFREWPEARVDQAVLEMLRIEPGVETPSAEFLREFDGREQVKTLAGILDRLLRSGEGARAE